MRKRGMIKSPNRTSGRNPLSRALGIFLAVTILCSAFIFGDNAVAPMAAEGLNLTDRVADPATQNNTGFVNIPGVHDGRIWTDKTVRPADAADAFNITLSALSQSVTEISGYAIPSDIVIIIDVSGSMAQYVVPGTNLSRIAVLSDALNEAMDILMSANEHNRVAVVAYGGRTGGYARVENVLTLGRYRPGANGAFFSVQTRGTLPSGTANTMYVHAVSASNDPIYQGSAVVSSLQVIGSTPTQWGIYHGINMLLDTNNVVTAVVPDTGPSAAQDATVTVTRRPNIILMTDGEPTMGWANWTFEADLTNIPLGNPLGSAQIGPNGVQLTRNQGVFFGDGSYGEMGVSLLNVLTAAHRKRLVEERYFPANWSDGQASQPEAGVGWFNISLGDPNRPLINAMMDPINHGGILPNNVSGGSVSGSNPEEGQGPTMLQRLQNFAVPSGTTSFYALYRYGFTYYRWYPIANESSVTITNNVPGPSSPNHITSGEINYISANGFFQANDVSALREAFISIANSIQNQTIMGDVTYAPPGEDNFGGWLVFSDVIGEFMQFRGAPRLTFPAFAAGVTTPGRGHPEMEAIPIDFTNSVQRNAFEPILVEHFNFGTPDAMDLPRVTALVQASIDAGYTNSIRYFADRNRNFVGNYNPNNPPAGADAMVEIFPMRGPVHSSQGGANTYTDVMHIAFHLVTALRAGNFYEIANLTADGVAPTTRTLAAGDQLVRWYIPLGLIPLRNVQVVDTPAAGTVTVRGNAQPVRVTFTVGLDQERVAAGLPAAYVEANTVDGRTFFYSNRWRDNQNVSFAFFQPGPRNPFYWEGRPGSNDALGTVTKQANPTQTIGHVVRPLSFDGAIMNDLHWLGNNGRITLVQPVVAAEEAADPAVPQTGDENRIGLYVAIMLVALFLIGGTVFVYVRAQRRKNN